MRSLGWYLLCISESATVIFLGFFKNFEPLGLSQDDVWEIRKILIVDWSLQISSVSLILFTFRSN
jgi:hypothetical protein